MMRVGETFQDLVRVHGRRFKKVLFVMAKEGLSWFMFISVSKVSLYLSYDLDKSEHIDTPRYSVSQCK